MGQCIYNNVYYSKCGQKMLRALGEERTGEIGKASIRVN